MNAPWFYAPLPGTTAELLWHTCLGARACLLVIGRQGAVWQCLCCGASQPYDTLRWWLIYGVARWLCSRS